MAFDDQGPMLAEKRTGYTYKGREITLSGIRGRPMDRRLPVKKGFYSEETKLHAAALYAVTGDIKQSADIAKVPPTALRNWRNESWFQAVIEEIRQENNSKVEAKMNKILETAVDQIADRIENGNQQLDQKTSKLIFVPVSLRDLTAVTATIIEKRQTILGKDGTEGAVSAVQRLENLANQFEKMVGKVKKPQIIDVEFKEIENGDAKGIVQRDAPVSREIDLESQLRDYQRKPRTIEAVFVAEEQVSGGTELQAERP